MTPQFCLAIHYDEYYPNDSANERNEFLKEFFDNCAYVGVTYYSEVATIDDLKIKLGEVEGTLSKCRIINFENPFRLTILVERIIK